MTQRFNGFIDFTLQHEGGKYENDPDDPGGETRWGIDRRSHPTVDIKNLTKEAATEIYFDSYWKNNGCELLADKLGESHFDACVNCGSGRANKFLRLAGSSAAKYNNERIAFYHRLAAARPASQKFLRGWLARVSDLNQFLHVQ